MKRIFVIIMSYFWAYQSVFSADNILWLSNDKIRNGDINIDDIPLVIKSAINFFLGIAGTVAVVFVIIWAYKILFGSLQQDKSKWRDTIVAALWWFALATLSWLIVRFIIDNLS